VHTHNYLKKKKGFEGLELDARICIAKAEYLRTRLGEIAPHSEAKRYNKFSTTVVFKRPSKIMEMKYQLATTGQIAHIVVTPSVSKTLLDNFIDEYVSENLSSK
jgi:histidine decarboxylase